jgi:hypothetical protein
MARSRVATGVRTLYSASDKLTSMSADILAKEFDSKVKKMNCLDSVKFAVHTDKALEEMLKDEEFRPDNGESIVEARDRFGTCMGGIIAKHQDDVVAVVVEPLMAFLFYSHVTATPFDISEFHSTGHASCASYEYSRGWSVIMPPDNSFLSEPTTVLDTLSG